MAKKTIFAGTAFFITSISFSQKGKIERYISDAENKTPLNGANVIISKNKGNNTDAFGKFSINDIHPGQYELVVSRISYKTEVIPIEVKENFASSVSLEMKKEKLDLAEVTINGKKSSPLSTIGSVDMHVINLVYGYLAIWI